MVYILGPEHTPKSAAGFLQLEVKEICVSVGTRRPGEEQRGKLEEGWGGDPLRAPWFPVSDTWNLFLSQWGALCGACRGEDPEELHKYNYFRYIGLSPQADLGTH